MQLSTYTKGLILWVDDSLDVNKIKQNTWVELFGESSDLVFRLMDLSVDIATNFMDAKEKIDQFNSYRQAGIYVYCILDLTLPKDSHGEPRLQYGIALAKLLLANNISFSILSANSGAEKKLSEEGLSAIPYYSKDYKAEFLLPESLVLKILSEFRRNISWISISQVIDLIHPDSTFINTVKLIPNTFKYYPYFGPHRDYVDRCEYRSSFELPKVFSIRSPRSHCHEYVQQALCVLLYQTIAFKSDHPIIYYGTVTNQEYLIELSKEKYASDANLIVVIRLDNDVLRSEEIVNLINQAFNRAGKTIFIISNDETSEEISLLFQQELIPTVDELPQSRLGDLHQREEMVRHCSMLSIHLWLRQQHSSNNSVLLEKGCFVYPEILINPLDWRILNETSETPDELSDAFEIVREMNESFNSISDSQFDAIRKLLIQLDPLPYNLLLRVGYLTVENSKSKVKIEEWLIDTIINWLKQSWQYPNNMNIENLYEILNGKGVFNELDGVKWQNNCYEILVGLIAGLKKVTSETNNKYLSKELSTAVSFIGNLGGLKFLNSPINKINWLEIENSRWPYKNYPLPAAIVRKFKEAGRYLWIQPEGLDIAVTLPGGRLRYRNLSFLVNRYWSTISWIASITDDLPNGWDTSVKFLIDLVSENQITKSWQNDREHVWHALMTLLRNGCPIIFITDQLFKKSSIIQGKNSTKSILTSTHGYGSLLGKIRGSRKLKYHDFFQLDSNNYLFDYEIQRIRDSQKIYSIVNALRDTNIKISPSEVYNTIEEFLLRIQQANLHEEDSIYQYSINRFIKESIEGNIDLLNSEGWYIDTNELSGLSIDGIVNKGTKADYFWDKLDSLIALNSISYPARYFDGYAFLSLINEIRNENKDSIKPNIDSKVFEIIMEYFLCGIESILSQLAWCVDSYGEKKYAERLYSPWIRVAPSLQLSENEKNDLSQIMRIEKKGKQWRLYSLGITGRADRLCYYDGEQPVELKIT